MSTISLSRPTRRGDLRAGLPFAGVALVVAAVSAFLAGWLPIGFSIVTVFLFAGPHNWLELRYFIGRMPARWGRLRGYFLFAFAGIFGLSAVQIFLTVRYSNLDWTNRAAYDQSTQLLFNSSAAWNTALVLWIATLVHLRSRQNPRRDWSWIWPLSFLLIALTWLDPFLWGMALVYGHPLVAFWVLDRELKRSRPQWRPAYHLALCAVPLFLGLLWWLLAGSPPLPGTDAMSLRMDSSLTMRSLTMRIADHAGEGIITAASSHLLVSTHTFLEMLHYGVWVIVIPLVAYRTKPWRLDVPLARRSPTWRQGLLLALAGSLAIVVLLWGCFLANYPLTRDVYFTVALLHVLAEVPFLLRAI